MRSDECVFNQRGYACYTFHCVTCGWFSHSADKQWSHRAGIAHTQLKPGPLVSQQAEMDHGL